MTNVRSFKQMSKPAATVGGHSELGAAASTKAVWWDLRLASLLTHLFSCVPQLWSRPLVSVCGQGVCHCACTYGCLVYYQSCKYILVFKILNKTRAVRCVCSYAELLPCLSWDEIAFTALMLLVCASGRAADL